VRSDRLGAVGPLPGEQFVEEHAERVNVAASVDIEAGELGLLGAHIGRCANEHLEGCENGFVGQTLIRGGFGNPKIDHPGCSHAFQRLRYENIGRFDVPMDDAPLMRVLDCLTDLHKKPKPILRRE
jgi:hypothetical protein